MSHKRCLRKLLCVNALSCTSPLPAIPSRTLHFLMARHSKPRQRLSAAISGGISAIDAGSLSVARADELELISTLRQAKQIARVELSDQSLSGSHIVHRRAAKQKLFEQIQDLEAQSSPKIGRKKARRLTLRLRKTALIRTLKVLPNRMPSRGSSVVLKSG